MHSMNESSYGRYADCSSTKGVCSTPPAYEHLNGGFVMGPVTEVHRVMSYIQAELPMESESEQRVMHKVLFDHPDDITLDYSGSLILNLGNFAHGSIPGEVIEVAEGRVLN